MPMKGKKSPADRLRVFDLRVDGLSGSPMIGNAAPHLAWKIAGAPGTLQGAYRICASSEADQAGEPDLWDSGWVASEQSVGVPWGGAVLPSRQRVFWRVAVRDQEGNASAFSETAVFETALLRKSDWKARWIYLAGANGSCSSPCPYFRREFELRKKPVRAVLYVTARGLFEARINGERVGFDHFVPGWTDFRQQIQYISYDVTSLLKRGRNAAGAVLGDGWYCGYLSGRKRNTYGECPELLFQLEIRYADGSCDMILSGRDWKCATGPILSSDIYDGEEYDARLEMPGWDRPGFDDAKWAKAACGEAASKSPALVRKCCPPVRRIMELAPVRILNPQKDIYIWDFGQNIAGRVRVRVKGYPGRLYSFHFGEMLNPDGTLYNLNYRSAKSTDYYTCRGPVDGFEEWEPLFTFHGFRYLQINGFQYSGAKPEDIEAVAVVMHSDLEVTGSFSCGAEKVNQLYSNVCWGQRGNFFEVPTDCPQRDERLGWTGDADVFAATAAFNMDVAAFFRKWLRDLREAQRADGAVPCVAPNLFDICWGAAAWADAAVRVPWIVYLRYGDAAILEECFDAMKKWVDYQKNTSRNLIRPKTAYGDWLALSAVETPSSLIGTAFFAETARIVGEAARVLGRREDAASYARLANRVKKTFRREFVGADGLLKIRSQTSCVLALEFDLLEAADISKNADLLVKLIRENGGRLATGFVGTAWLNSALSKSNHAETACDLLLQEEYPSWLFSVNQGATTIWERWNSYTVKEGFGRVSMNSFNHYAYGAVAEWMTSCVGGIRFADDGPGGKILLFAAEPDRRLGHAECGLKTPYGEVRSAWEFTSGSWIWRIAAPCNTRIRVVLPGLAAKKTTLDGKTVESGEFDLPNGSYEIRMDLKTIKPTQKRKG
ncbi:MAG: family 78 glycoside hydrolase catalytic domain [Lentisphaeria bacterium]|nr:family 78 glycoside hydrolase catalytic domain [Lentisphaeria bacterium]